LGDYLVGKQQQVDVGKRTGKFALTFIFRVWLIVVIAVVVLIESIWLPNSLNAELDRQINQFQLVLQVSSRLANKQSSDQERALLLQQLNQKAVSQDWQEIVFAPEIDLRNQAKSELHRQLLLQRMPDSNYAYGLWFSPSDVIQEKRFTYRSFEFFVIALITLMVVLIWRRRTLLHEKLDNISLAAQALSNGDTSKPFPSLNPRSSLLKLANAFEIIRSSQSAMRRTMRSQVETIKIIEQRLLTQTTEKKLAEQRLLESHQVASIGSWEWEITTDRVWCSQSLIETLGLDSEKSVLKVEDFLQQVHSADKKTLLKKIRANIHIGASISSEFRLSLDGNIKHVHLLANVRRHQDSSLKMVGTCQDISGRKSIEFLLRKLTSVITATNSGVMITDVIGTIEYVNPRYAQSGGFEVSELEGIPSVMLSRECLPQDQYDSMWKDILSGKNWRGDLENIRKDGSFYWSNVVISPINNEYEELTNFVILVEDISELKDAKEKMKHLALYDGLTGLPNRRLFYRALKKLFQSNVMDSPSVVMLFDLDGFKNINDAQGHAVGDKVLIEVANRLEQYLPEESVVARLGGDEFAMLINEVRDVEQVDIIAQNYLKVISKPYAIEGAEIKISTSIGLSWLPKDGRLPDTILKNADLAMHQAKEMGRNQYRQFTEQLNEQVQRYIRFSKEMPDALRKGQFRLDFQPKVDLRANQIIGVEALVRWQHPELGLVSPFDFISIAEDTGFIVPLGNWVFAEACRNMKKMRDLGDANISCAINISLRQFKDPTLLGVMEKSLRDNQIEPRLIEVEITESLLMEDVEQAILTLQKIKQLGISVAIDDFGTGFSSFAYLKSLPIDVLKVDRTFVKDIPLSEGDMKITSAIISMAHSLNLKVVAEGIETDDQRQFLIEQDCDIGQGYLFGKPVSIDRLKEVLDNY